MTTNSRRGLRACAYVTGYPALALHLLLRKYGVDVLGEVERSVALGKLPPSVLIEVCDTIADINEAAARWVDSQGPRTARTVDGPIPTGPAVMAALLKEITTEQAADILCVQPRQIRKLIQAGHLDGRKVGPTWLVDASSVDRHRRQQ